MFICLYFFRLLFYFAHYHALCLLSTWCFLPSSQYLCFRIRHLCVRPPLSPTSTHTLGHTHRRTQSPALSLCHVFVQFFFFSCFSHLCSCHVLVPVHQWASVLSTRSPWPKMSDQAAARQVHCAAGLCFTSSHPCTSCSVMLTVIESTQAAESEGDGKGPVLFRGLNSCSLDRHCSASGPGCSLGFLGFGNWKEVLRGALGAASSTLLC